MRKLEIGTDRHTQVLVMDERGAGNANHTYHITTIPKEGEAMRLLGVVDFQNGPIGEHGVNGVMNEDLLCIVIDRLRGFQDGKYNCEENQIALEKIFDGLAALCNRTNKRVALGIEGTSAV